MAYLVLGDSESLLKDGLGFSPVFQAPRLKSDDNPVGGASLSVAEAVCVATAWLSPADKPSFSDVAVAAMDLLSLNSLPI